MTTEPLYRLTLTQTQLAAVRDACELLSRIHIGQLEHVAEKLHGLPYETRLQLTESLRALNPLVTGLAQPHASRASSETMRLHHEVSWGIYHAARYQLHMEQDTSSDDWSVMTRPPQPEGGQPVPAIERVELAPASFASPGGIQNNGPIQPGERCRHSKSGDVYTVRSRRLSEGSLPEGSILASGEIVTDDIQAGEQVVGYRRDADGRAFVRPARLFDVPGRFSRLAGQNAEGALETRKDPQEGQGGPGNARSGSPSEAQQ